MNDPTYPPGEFKAVDPWAHRSAGMTCETCMWFVIKQVDVAVIKSMKSLGRCRRHAPTMNGYPAVYTHDWCGDHKLDENKIESRTLIKDYPEKMEAVEKYDLDHITPGDPPDYSRPGGTGKPPMADMPSTSKGLHD